MEGHRNNRVLGVAVRFHLSLGGPSGLFRKLLIEGLGLGIGESGLEGGKFSAMSVEHHIECVVSLVKFNYNFLYTLIA